MEPATFSKKDFISVKTTGINFDYLMERCLGYGSFGEVYLGKHRRSKRQVAIKKIPINSTSANELESIFNEVKILIECVSL